MMKHRFTPVGLWTFAALCFLVLGAGAASAPAEPLTGGTLIPTTIPQFVEPLVIPPVMPSAGVKFDHKLGKFVPYYEIEVVQFTQQILPATDGLGNALPPTTVWSYAAVGRPETRNYPAFTIESLKGLPTRIKWINNLKDPDSGKFLPHLLPVDQTLHWANPPQECADGPARTDCKGMDPTPYTGPVPIVTHLHGSHVRPESDGYPEAWFLPAASNIPDGFAKQGTRYSDHLGGSGKDKGFAVYQYPNDQPSTTLWFHDHTLGMTRVNVYAGPAGFYLIRDLADLSLRLPAPAPLPGTDPNGNPLVRRLVREIPIVIQDRSFNTDGSLFYPDNRAFFEGLNQPPDIPYLDIPFSPFSDVAPIWNPEFFGNAMVVNGKTWPFFDVERRKYRFRFLNGSDSRFLILRFAGEALTFHQVGGDQGFLPSPVPQKRLLLGPAERADVIVDFSGIRAGRSIVLENIGPDEPFGGGVPCVDGLDIASGGCDFLPSDPNTTGVVMAFNVKPRILPDLSRIPTGLPAEGPLPAVTKTRQLSLIEEESAVVCVGTDASGNISALDCTQGGVPFGPTAGKLGTLEGGMGMPMMWGEPITENPALNSTEMWEIYNFTADAHPIHLHLVRFKVLERQDLVLDPDTGMSAMPAELSGAPRQAEPWEAGYKDTVIAYPGQVTRIAATYDIPGLFVWHCHILEHEDNEMMRPYCVGMPGVDCPPELFAQPPPM